MDLYEWREASSEERDDASDNGNHSDLFDLSTHSSGSSFDSSSAEDAESYASDEGDDSGSASSALGRERVAEAQDRRADSLHEQVRLFVSANPSVRGVEKLQRRIANAAANRSSRALRHMAVFVQVLEREPHVVEVCAAVRAPGGPRGGAQVDIVSCGGLRWLRVRSAGARRLRAELRAGSGRWEKALVPLVRRAAAARLPQRKVPEVLVVFCRRVPRVVAAAIGATGARAQSLVALKNETLVPPPRYLQRFVCFDTTALIAICSETCFVEDHDAAARELHKYAFLAEQVRHEREDRCIAAHIEPALRERMQWKRSAELAEFKGCCDQTFVATARPVDVSWIDALIGDAAGAPRESDLVREVADAQATDDDLWPNWFIADHTLEAFRRIAETVAGMQELRRARSLLRCCHVLSADYARLEANDGEEILTHVMRHCTKGENSRRNQLVFGLCDVLGGVMLSSNKHFIAAASDKNIEILHIAHPARALTELKLCGLTRREGPSVLSPVEVQKNPACSST